jgi:hypothetical protein
MGWYIFIVVDGLINTPLVNMSNSTHYTDPGLETQALASGKNNIPRY